MELNYDPNGNMITDSSKGVNSIIYNHLNLPTTVTTSQGTLNYTYDASGVKLQKTVGSDVTQYAGAFLYKNGSLEMIHTPEGYIAHDNGVFKYVYRITDHLGNTRVSFKDSDGDGSIDTENEVVEVNDYYPYGLVQQHKDKVVGGELGDKFRFAGKEFEDDLDLNTVAYEWRSYDPAIARFNKVDRFAEKYETLTPYHFAASSPIYFREIAGDSINVAELYAKDADGNYLNPSQVNAFEHFAKSKIGKAYLSKFASKGQKIAGVEFDKDGELHSEGFDINFGTEPTDNSGDGTTGLEKDNNGRWQFTVDFKASSDGLYENVGALAHELFVHVENFLPDMYDDAQKNYSNMPNWVKQRHTRRQWHHKHERILARDNRSKSMWFTQGFDLMLIINKQSKNKTREQVWYDLFDGL